MILWTLKFAFNKLIGRVPEKNREKYRIAFEQLLSEVVRAAAKGAVEGAKNG